MSAVKERIFGAITIMTDSDAATVWEFIANQFPGRSWEDIEETAPDAWDRKMLREIDEDPDCHEFISSEDAMKELGL